MSEDEAIEPSPSSLKAFEEFYQQPIIMQSVSRLNGDAAFKRALFWNAFVSGCQYAVERCEAEHGNKTHV